MKVIGCLLGFILFVQGEVNAQKTMTSGRLDIPYEIPPMPDSKPPKPVTKKSDAKSSKSKSASSKNTASEAGLPNPAEQMTTYLKTLTDNFLGLQQSGYQVANNSILRINFHNPFNWVAAGGEALLSSGWSAVKDYFKDDEETNDFTRLSQEIDDGGQVRGYVPDYDRMYGFTQPTSQTSFSLNDIAYDDAGYSTSLQVADKAMDYALDNVGPGLGGRLKSIKEIGDATIKLFSRQIDNFSSGSEQTSEQIWREYKQEVGKSFANAFSPVRGFNEMVDNVKDKAGKVNSFIKTLLH